jgi:hypothetical protein
MPVIPLAKPQDILLKRTCAYGLEEDIKRLIERKLRSEDEDEDEEVDDRRRCG